MPVTNYDLFEITKHALNALNASNLTDAEINPWTTAAQLLATFTGRATGEYQQRQDMEFHYASIQAAIAAGVFTDANVAAANTLAGLRTVVINAATAAGLTPALPATYNSGNRAWN